MKLYELKIFLKKQIPLVSALGVEVLKANDDLVEIQAPLEPNRNHLGTVFGGSTYAISVLTCYTWLYNILETRKQVCHVVIKSGQIKYIQPVKGNIVSRCYAPTAQDFDSFLATLARKKRAQITLRSEVIFNSNAVCIFEGEFVANLD